MPTLNSTKSRINITLSATLLLTLFSCDNSEKASEKQVQDSVVQAVTIVEPTIEEEEGNKINYDETKVLREVFVLSRAGTEIKQQADKGAKTLGRYEYGTKLDIIEDTKNWLGVRDRITREYTKNGNKIESTGWEKVYVLKDAIGSIDEIALLPSDLNIITLLTVNDKTENFETGKELERFFKFELVDKEIFESKKSSAVSYLLVDTNDIKKKNGVIQLKCQAKVRKYVDKPYAEEDRQVYKYEGQLGFLNQYLISGSYYESSDYTFVDKSSGEQTQSFGDFPNISPDKKHIIAIYANPYETTADLELYTINDRKIKPVMSASFKNWMPNLEPGEMFWSSDTYLYIAVNHAKSFWKQDGNLNDNCQYLRIKVL